MSQTLSPPPREFEDGQRTPTVSSRSAPWPAASDVVLVDDTADQTIKWTPGERFHHVFEQVVDDLITRGEEGMSAVELDDGSTVSFLQLDRLANGLARRLAAVGIRSGDRVGLLFDRSAHPYIAMLATSKLHATWVPLDTSFPADRIDYICGDAGVHAILTQASLIPLLAGVDIRIELVDDDEPAGDRLSAREITGQSDELAYIVYTSGTTGQPKGVGIEHASICNFIRVAAEHYGYRPRDRVYQGLTIAFDFSFEEIWVPLVACATLVPAPPSVSLVGSELTEFLLARRITALCCVPTLLATVDEVIPELRLVLVSGEACPEDLVRRWHAPHRRFLNLYGPTETTVSATWTPLIPDEPVTIGIPLPTYSVVVVDPESHQPLRFGEEGVIAVAGVGLSPGYIGRADLTANAFIPAPLDMPGNPSGRLYLTGDLGCINAGGRIEYRGRVDSQVKIRGYRIELVEIESALMEQPGVAQAAVITTLSETGEKELAAFYSARPGTDQVDHDAVMRALRERLPPFMVPVYLERLDRIPMQASGKVERRALSAPAGPRYVTGGVMVEPDRPLESALADAMAVALGLPQISVEADFFADLGADSLLIARFCAAVRADGSLPTLTTKDVYLNASIRRLAAALATAPTTAPVPLPPSRTPHHATRLAHLACGAAQAAAFLLYLMIPGVFLFESYTHVKLDHVTWEGWLASNLAAVAVTMLGMLAMAALPLALKWTLIGRYGTEPIPVWSVRYFRFWLVRASLRFSPALLLAGSPAYNIYLRALGMRVGRHALVLTHMPPVCADLITVGDKAVINSGVNFDAYRVENGWLMPGRVHIGADAVIGDSALLDINTRIGDGGSLAHSSALLEGQEIPAGCRWHGSPAVEAAAIAPLPASPPVSTLYRALFGVGSVVGGTFFAAQVGVAVFDIALTVDITHPGRALLFVLVLLAATAIVRVSVPRLAGRSLRPGRVYRVYGLHWMLFLLVARTSNSRFFNELFGDSSAILHYLRAIGIRFPNPVQTGSNFGMAQKQHVPTMCSVGSASIASDDFSMPNADYTADGFRVREIRVGDRVFMGNGVLFPPGATVGDDVLLATKVMVPIDGPFRTGVGLLGSPAFEIPRTVARDTRFDHLREGEEFRRRLAEKNRHNLITALLYLGTRFVALFAGVISLLTLIGFGPAGIAVGAILTLLFSLALLTFIDAASRRFRPLAPLYCSLYDLRFWRHERYWKLSDPLLINLFDGTPFKPLAWRLLGVKVGRMLFDDGCFMPERTLVTVGDNVTLGAGSVLHGHSLEDGTFKSDRIRIGSGSTVGHGAVVHYGTEVGEQAMIAPDAFLMKGERADPGTLWRGNPAVLVGTRAASAEFEPGRGHRPEAAGAMPARSPASVGRHAA